MLLNGVQAPNYAPIGPNDKVQAVHGGGIEWTIKDGIPYHVPTLMKEVKDLVTKARADRMRTTSQQHRSAPCVAQPCGRYCRFSRQAFCDQRPSETNRPAPGRASY